MRKIKKGDNVVVVTRRDKGQRIDQFQFAHPTLPVRRAQRWRLRSMS